MEPRKIDPANPGKGDVKIINDIISQHEQPNLTQTKISKSVPKKLKRGQQKPNDPKIYQVNGEDIYLSNALIKFKDDYLIVKEAIGKGSGATKAKLLPAKYTKNTQKQDGKYEFTRLSKQDEQVIKVMRTPDPNLWQGLKVSAQREVEMLRASGDPNADIYIDEAEGKNPKIYIKSSKAPGMSLDNFLCQKSNLKLPLKERMEIIDLFHAELERLHKLGIYHLDLKLENIFYDPNTKKITIIDWGSAIKINPETDAKKTLEGLYNKSEEMYSHPTTSRLEPPHQIKNTPAQIDAFSAAGVDALILCDWSKRQNDKNWAKQPIFNKKTMMPGTGFVSDGEENRAYNFSYLKDPTALPYLALNPNYGDAVLLQKYAEQLENLGDVNKENRQTLQGFSKNIKSLNHNFHLMTTPYSSLNEKDQTQFKTILNNLNLDAKKLSESDKTLKQIFTEVISARSEKTIQIKKSPTLDTLTKSYGHLLDYLDKEDQLNAYKHSKNIFKRNITLFKSGKSRTTFVDAGEANSDKTTKKI